MAKEGGSRGGVEAVEKALILLQCFRVADEQLSLAVLAQRSALPKSTILRLTHTLIDRDFLDRTPAGAFMLGGELRRLGRLTTSRDLAEIVKPVLQRLSAQVHETTSFYIRDGDERICLFRENASRSARHHLDEGSRHPLDRGAAGLLLLAMAGDPGPMAADIRRQGWALSLGGRDPELAALACPVQGRDGETVGALTISGLIGRFTPDAVERHLEQLLLHARRINEMLRCND